MRTTRGPLPSFGGFTLVELLVVIGIISLLVSILLPVMGRVRRAAESTSCKSLLRQYAMATQMYMNDNNGVNVDAYMFLDYFCGLARYMSGSAMPEKIARCPGDSATEAMGRLGLMGAGADPADAARPWLLRKADGTPFTVLCSIGGNQNSLSASRRRTSVGYSAMWVKLTRMNVAGSNKSKTMIWADWQNNPLVEKPVSAIVSPGAPGTTDIGSLCFRHNGAANAAFLDGHVGELLPTVPVTAEGHNLAAPWPAWTGFAEASYPWAPRNNGGRYGVGITVNGEKVEDFPGIKIR